MSAALDNSFAAVAGSENGSHHGGWGVLIDLSAVATVATAVGGGGVVDSGVNSSDDKVSVESAPLFGVDVLNDSPTFSVNIDLMPDSPMDNEVSMVSIHFTLVCLIIWKVTRLASPIALLSSSAFCLKQVLSCATWMKLRMISSRTNSVDLPTDFCRKKSGNWQLGGAAEWINSAPAHEEAIGGVALERGVSGKISLSSEF